MNTLVLATALNLILALETGTVTLESFFQRECERGDQTACMKAKELDEGTELQGIIHDRSEHYWESVDTSTLMLDQKRPDLQSAYPLVMHDFIQAEINAGYDVALKEERLPVCARHYHDHWLFRKLWWPSNEDGQPDWPSIYVYIVDHYYGYCLHSPDLN